ncbi:hypothetical protein O6H91_12G090100 [Diphasiastrum complanatum]|uniref:Uncharacterized protein n=1 Tax=Diphasiastrum complanatum TaxID=34168 RepID=A0ACC2C535_DIPCM|nr:hypothetical protein O6H91_12G090100 [Diphasiastrum complanatum]
MQLLLCCFLSKFLVLTIMFQLHVYCCRLVESSVMQFQCGSFYRRQYNLAFNGLESSGIATQQTKPQRLL